jgi:hypothetical protein
MTKMETPPSDHGQTERPLSEDELDAVTGGFLGVVFHRTRNDNIYSSEVDTGRRVQKN